MTTQHSLAEEDFVCEDTFQMDSERSLRVSDSSDYGCERPETLLCGGSHHSLRKSDICRVSHHSLRESDTGCDRPEDLLQKDICRLSVENSIQKRNRKDRILSKSQEHWQGRDRVISEKSVRSKRAQGEPSLYPMNDLLSVEDGSFSVDEVFEKVPRRCSGEFDHSASRTSITQTETSFSCDDGLHDSFSNIFEASYISPRSTKQPHSVSSRTGDDAIEVSPGKWMTLRGTEETMNSIASGKAILVLCIQCSAPLRCVPDCDFIVCPDCRVLSPAIMVETTATAGAEAGVGLGLNWAD